MTVDKEQNERIRLIETRINEVENQLAAISAKLEVVQNLSRGVLVIAGVVLGIDVMPMLST